MLWSGYFIISHEVMNKEDNPQPPTKKLCKL